MTSENPDRIILTREELQSLMRETIVQTLTSCGVDLSEPIELQADFRFVRDWRRSTESIRGKAILAAVGLLVVGLLGVLWLGFKALLSR